MTFEMTREPLSRTFGGREDALLCGVVRKQSWIPGKHYSCRPLRGRASSIFKGVVDIELRPVEENVQQTQHMFIGEPWMA